MALAVFDFGKPFALVLVLDVVWLNVPPFFVGYIIQLTFHPFEDGGKRYESGVFDMNAAQRWFLIHQFQNINIRDPKRHIHQP
jgi:hypothetical protein